MTRYALVRGGTAAVLLLLTCGTGAPAEPFPFDQELLLDAAPMRPGKRMPALTVEPNGNAKIDLWCMTVPARVEISDADNQDRTRPFAGRSARDDERRAMHARAHAGG